MNQVGELSWWTMCSFWFFFLDWGLSRTWCKGASEYKKIQRHWSKGRVDDTVSGTPLSCTIIPHPVLHRSTHGIKKTRGFIYTGKYTNFALRYLFPKWSVDRREYWNSTEIIASGPHIDRNGSTPQRPSSAPRVVDMKTPSTLPRGAIKKTCKQTVSINFNGSRIFFWT